MATDTPLPGPLTSLTVFRGRPGLVYSWSPFVTKLEARLRFAGLRYDAEAGSIPRAPRGKIAYARIVLAETERQGDEPTLAEGQEGAGRVFTKGASVGVGAAAAADATAADTDITTTTGITGTIITMDDSSLITRTLISAGCLPDLNAALGPTARAFDAGLRALLEEKLYFTQVHERWILHYYVMRDTILNALPWLARMPLGVLVYRQVARSLRGQGLMLLTKGEIDEMKAEIWTTLEAFVADAHAAWVRHAEEEEEEAADDGPFWLLGGEEPTEADAVLFGFIASSMVCTA